MIQDRALSPNHPDRSDTKKEISITRRPVSPTTRWLFGILGALGVVVSGYYMTGFADEAVSTHDTSGVAHNELFEKAVRKIETVDDQASSALESHNVEKFAHPNIQQDMREFQLEQTRLILDKLEELKRGQ